MRASHTRAVAPVVRKTVDYREEKSPVAHVGPVVSDFRVHLLRGPNKSFTQRINSTQCLAKEFPWRWSK